jgi:hypothetical protein
MTKSFLGLGAALAALLAGGFALFSCEEDTLIQGRVAEGIDVGQVPEPEAGPAASDPEPAPIDELCALYERRSAVFEQTGAPVTAAAFEAHTRANVEFYGDAAAVLDEPEASTFRVVQQHFEAMVAFHEPRGWNPDLLARLEEPPLPVEENGSAILVLTARGCIAPAEGEG